MSGTWACGALGIQAGANPNVAQACCHMPGISHGLNLVGQATNILGRKGPGATWNSDGPRAAVTWGLSLYSLRMGETLASYGHLQGWHRWSSCSQAPEYPLDAQDFQSLSRVLST